MELARGLVAKHAAVAVDASGSSEAGAAEEPLLSGPEDVRLDPEDVRRLPKTSERMRAEDSEDTVWYVLDWHTGHLRRVKMESSAVADKESSAVAGGVPRSGGQVVGKGRARGLQVEGCMLLVEGREDEDEEESSQATTLKDDDEEKSSQATTLHLGSPAKGRDVCPDGGDFEDLDCPCDHDGGEMRRLQREDDEDEALEHKTLHAKVGKGKGRSGGRAALKRDRKANNTEKGNKAERCTVGRGQRPEPRYGPFAWKLYAEFREEVRKKQVERERNRKEKGNDKEEDEQMEEFKRKAKKARETLEKTNAMLAGIAARYGSG